MWSSRSRCSDCSHARAVSWLAKRCTTTQSTWAGGWGGRTVWSRKPGKCARAWFTCSCQRANSSSWLGDTRVWVTSVTAEEGTADTWGDVAIISSPHCAHGHAARGVPDRGLDQVAGARGTRYRWRRGRSAGSRPVHPRLDRTSDRCRVGRSLEHGQPTAPNTGITDATRCSLTSRIHPAGPGPSWPAPDLEWGGRTDRDDGSAGKRPPASTGLRVARAARLGPRPRRF